MPSSHHYTSTNSVSSLSISSMSSCSSDSDFDSESGREDGSRHTSLTSWSKKMGNRRRTASTTSWYGRPPNVRGSPSPLEPRSEDEDEDEDVDEDELRLVASERALRNQRKRYEAVRPVREPPVVEYHGRRDSASRSVASPTAITPEHQPANATTYSHVSNSYSSCAIPSNPTTFSRHFPSNRPLTISHPPTEDGNLNLSIDAPTENGPLTLFHLRMHNLKAREFSLRRYGRESGREICKSTRKQRKAPGSQELSEKKQEKNKASSRQRRGSTAQSVARSLSGMLGKQMKKERRESNASTSPVIVHQNQSPQSSHSRSHSNPISPTSPLSRTSPGSPAKPADLRRVDSGYSSGGNGSPSPSWHITAAAAEAKAGCLRDSGLEHLEEEPEDLDIDKRGDFFDLPEDLDLDDEADDETAAVFQDTYLPKDTIKLEFSNYTHLDLRRRGPMAASKRYEFEYWGVKYAWKRVLQPQRRASVATGSSSLQSQRQQSDHAAKERQETETMETLNVELHLHCAGESRPVAIIAPKPLSPREAADEAAMGSWVPPSTIRILSEELYTAHNAADVCDVVMATGLVALTDNRVRQRWHESPGVLERLPKLSTANWPRLDMKMFSPKRLSLSNSDEKGEDKRTSDSPSSEVSQLDGSVFYKQPASLRSRRQVA